MIFVSSADKTVSEFFLTFISKNDRTFGKSTHKNQVFFDMLCVESDSEMFSIVDILDMHVEFIFRACHGKNQL